MCDELDKPSICNIPYGMFNGQPAAKHLKRTMNDFNKHALINAFLGDAHFWRHPESVNSNIVWTSIHRSWLRWKRDNLLGDNVGSRIRSVRKAGAKGCFPNAKELFELKTHVHPAITEAHDNWKLETALEFADRLDIAIWYLDDGSAIARRDNPRSGSYRILISVGSITAEMLFPLMKNLYGVPSSGLGRICKNNSKATERNNSWIIPKPVAVQILADARRISPPEFQYKVPLW